MLIKSRNEKKIKNIKKISTIVIATTIILSAFTFISLTYTNEINTIRINEIMYNPQGSDSGREWIEIYNTADSTINITDWKLYESDVNHSLTLINGSLEIPAKNFAIIADNYQNFLADYPQFNGTLLDSSFSLTNTGEYLAIKNASLEIIDELTYIPQDGADDTGMTIEYQTDNIWKVSQIINGTPGAPNSVWTPPSKPTDPIPENNSVNISINPKLSVKVTDSDNDTMDVYFYNAQNNNLIGIAENISNGSRAEVNWSNLEYNTTYYWYTVADDSFFENTSETWMFTTIHAPENNPPNKPSNPIPANGSTNININIDLQWTGGDPDGDPVTYDVYFGTNTPPPKESDNQTETIYDPGSLNLNTLYYWMIIAWDNHSASTKGPIWSFRTRGNGNPFPPSNPDPFNGETNVSIDTALSWSCTDPDGDPLVYDVYLDANNPTPVTLVSDGKSETTFTPTEPLEYGTNYYWQIVAHDFYGGKTNGPIWSFTTEIPEPPVVEIIKPKEKSFYLANTRLFPLPLITIVYGSIDIEVNATSESGIKYVHLYINGKLEGNISNSPYIFKWSPILCLIYKIKAKAFDNTGQSSEDTITVLKWRVHPVLLLAGSLIVLKQMKSPFKRTLVRGTVFNLRRVGNTYHGRAIRLHFTEFSGFTRVSGVIKLKRVSFEHSLWLRKYDIGPLGLTTYILGIVPGGIKY